MDEAKKAGMDPMWACGLRLGCARPPPSMAPHPLPPRGLLVPAANRWWRECGHGGSCCNRGLTAVCLQLCADSCVPHTCPTLQAGVDIFRVFDSLNDIDQLRFGIGEAAAARGFNGHSRRARAACRGWLLHTWP